MTQREPQLKPSIAIQKLVPYTAVVSAILAASIFALFAGSASQTFAQMSVQMGGPNFLREPINAGLAFLLLLMWRKWRPAARFSSPKWGQPVLGLATGLSVGVVLPGAVLWLLALSGQAVIKAPAVPMIALAVPFIFLIMHGFAEESLVRGIAQREGQNSFGALAGVGIAALCFCVLQALQGYIGMWHVINSALFGACLGFLALGPGGIWAAIGAHAGWSWLEIAVLGGPRQIVKSGTWIAGAGPDSYGSPLFTLVLITTLAVQLALHSRAQERTA